jgi:hypothetical protein
MRLGVPETACVALLATGFPPFVPQPATANEINKQLNALRPCMELSLCWDGVPVCWERGGE